MPNIHNERDHHQSQKSRQSQTAAYRDSERLKNFTATSHPQSDGKHSENGRCGGDQNGAKPEPGCFQEVMFKVSVRVFSRYVIEKINKNN